MSDTRSPTEVASGGRYAGRSPFERGRRVPRRPTGKPGWWRWTRRIHLIVGLTIGLIFSFAGITGSALVFRGEIDALLHPELLRVDPVTERVALDAVLAAADAAVSGEQPAWLQMPRSPVETFEVTTTGSDLYQVYVHPGTGQVLGMRRASETLPNVLFQLHHTLLAGEAGERVMGVTALLVFVLLATGLVVWWPGMRRGWKGLKRALTVRGSSNWRAVTFDLHRAGGFWVTALLAVSALTGASLVFHDAFMAGLNRITGSPARPAPPALESRAGAGAADGAWSVEAMVEAHDGGVPGEITYVLLPSSPEAPLTIRSKTETELHPSGRNFTYVDPAEGGVLAAEVDAEAPIGTRLYNVLYPVHIGRWAGLPSRGLTVLLGWTPLLLIVTGALMWWNRSRTRPRRTRRTTRDGTRPASRNRTRPASHR